MSDPQTWLASRNATFSRGSGSGPTRCVERVGPTIGPSGLEAALASLSATQAQAEGLLTSGTFGRTGIISSASAALRRCILGGRQSAWSKDGLGWLDLVQADLEGTGYACWPVDLCAAGVGAPHIRQRLWFVAADTHTHTHSRSSSAGRRR